MLNSLKVWNRKQNELVPFNTRKGEYMKNNVSDCVPRVRSLGVLMAQKLWLFHSAPLFSSTLSKQKGYWGLFRHWKVATSTSVSLTESLWGTGTSCFSSFAKLPWLGPNSFSSPYGLSSLFSFLLGVFGLPLSFLIASLAISCSSSVAASCSWLVELNGRAILGQRGTHSIMQKELVKQAHLLLNAKKPDSWCLRQRYVCGVYECAQHYYVQLID